MESEKKEKKKEKERERKREKRKGEHQKSFPFFFRFWKRSGDNVNDSNADLGTFFRQDKFFDESFVWNWFIGYLIDRKREKIEGRRQYFKNEQLVVVVNDK